jgi:hypothetical protein
VPVLKTEAKKFVVKLSATPIVTLYGATDGKAVGTYVEAAFHRLLVEACDYVSGNAASGIDLPEVHVGVKATSIKQPQSSCPFNQLNRRWMGWDTAWYPSMRIRRRNDSKAKAPILDFKHVVFVRRRERQTTERILKEPPALGCLTISNALLGDFSTVE